MRGESLEDFMKTRNTQVKYSVAGKEAVKGEAWAIRTRPEFGPQAWPEGATAQSGAACFGFSLP